MRFYGKAKAQWELSMMVALLGRLGDSRLLDNRVEFEGSKGSVHQAVLRESDTVRHSTNPAQNEGFIMGYGGALTLVNGSPHDFVLRSAPSYQMDAWSWPTVNAGMATERLEGKTLTSSR